MIFFLQNDTGQNPTSARGNHPVSPPDWKDPSVRKQIRLIRTNNPQTNLPRMLLRPSRLPILDDLRIGTLTVLRPATSHIWHRTKDPFPEILHHQHDPQPGNFMHIRQESNVERSSLPNRVPRDKFRDRISHSFVLNPDARQSNGREDPNREGSRGRARNRRVQTRLSREVPALLQYPHEFPQSPHDHRYRKYDQHGMHLRAPALPGAKNMYLTFSLNK